MLFYNLSTNVGLFGTIYIQENSAKHFQFECEIANYNQGNLSIQEYYSSFLNLWTKHSAILYVVVNQTSLSIIQEIYDTSKHDQFLMKLHSEFEVVRSALLNRNPVPSLDTCVSELLRKEQHLLTQGSMTHDVALSKPAIVAYVAHNKSKGRDIGQVQYFPYKQFGHITVIVIRSFSIIISNRVISLLIVPHVLHD